MILSHKNNEGARLIFVGLVRDFNKKQSGVTKIEYQSYNDMAEQEGNKILALALSQFEINRVACIHRIGLLSLQEVAIRLEIGSGHRLAALHACEYIMNEIKRCVPIWKKEFYGDKEVWI